MEANAGVSNHIQQYRLKYCTIPRASNQNNTIIPFFVQEDASLSVARQLHAEYAMRTRNATSLLSLLREKQRYLHAKLESNCLVSACAHHRKYMTYNVDTRLFFALWMAGPVSSESVGQRALPIDLV